VRNRIPKRFLGAFVASLLTLISQASCLLFFDLGAEARGAKKHTANLAKGHRAKKHAKSAPGHNHSRSHGRSRGRGRNHGHKRGHGHKSSYSHGAPKQAKHVYHPASVEAQSQPPDLSAEPRARNYALLSRAYSLYDQGCNDRLKGNFGAAVDKLSEAVSLFDQARSHQHNGQSSTLEAMTFYELGQAAEADGDFTLARDSYARSLKARTFPEGYLHIVNLLATQGNLPLAMKWLKDGLDVCPADVRLNELLTRLSVFSGEALQDAKDSAGSASPSQSSH
jgi:tetratricopeptide (TPR) repeat protein